MLILHFKFFSLFQNIYCTRLILKQETISCSGYIVQSLSCRFRAREPDTVDHNIWRLSKRLQSRPCNRSIERFFPVHSLIAYASCWGNETGHSGDEGNLLRLAVESGRNVSRFTSLQKLYAVTSLYRYCATRLRLVISPSCIALVQTIRNTVGVTQIQRFNRLHPAFYHFRPGYERSLYLPMQRRRGAYVVQTRGSLKNNSLYSRHVYCTLEWMADRGA